MGLKKARGPSVLAQPCSRRNAIRRKSGTPLAMGAFSGGRTPQKGSKSNSPLTRNADLALFPHTYAKRDFLSVLIMIPRKTLDLASPGISPSLPVAQEIVLYGTGILGKHVLKGLIQTGNPPVAICDGSEEQWGRQIEGFPILSPSQAIAKYGINATFVVCVFSSGSLFARIRRTLIEQGCSAVIPPLPFMWKHADTMLPFFPYDLPARILSQKEELQEVYAMLGDETSRELFEANLKFRVAGDLGAL